MPWLHRIAVTAVLLALAATLLPDAPARACSCAEPSLDELLEHEPDAAIVQVRRIDTDGGSRAVGAVERVLHGPAMPEQLPLALDDGASCLPWLAIGDVAVLAFVPAGDGWRTMECGRLAPTVGLDTLTPDPAASGPAAVALIGRLPGADIVALDDHLRVRAVAALDGDAVGLIACGERLLVSSYDPDGRAALHLLALPDLAVVDVHPFADEPRHDVQLLDAGCHDDGRVDALLMAWGDAPKVVLHRDVFGEAQRMELAPADDAALAGDDVVILLAGQDDTDGGDEARLALLEADGGSRPVLDLDGVTGYELSSAPGGDHVVVRGHADEPVLISVELATGREVGRSTGWWQPVQTPWLGPDRLLQVDEDAGGIGGSGLAAYRVVDLALEPVASLEPSPAWVVAAGAGAAVLADGGTITVVDDAGEVRSAVAHPWAGGVAGAALLGAVAPGPDERVTELPPVDPALQTAGGGDGSSAVAIDTATAATLAVAVLAALALATSAARRRRQARRVPG